MIRRLLARFGWAVIRTWTERQRSIQIARRESHFYIGWWRTK
jgi:hypothetical protein